MHGQANKRTLEETWGMQACHRCGESLILGEGFLRERGSRRREVLCLDFAARPVALFEEQVHWGGSERRSSALPPSAMTILTPHLLDVVAGLSP
jgi:hypothetical protein